MTYLAVVIALLWLGFCILADTPERKAAARVCTLVITATFLVLLGIDHFRGDKDDPHPYEIIVTDQEEKV